MIPHLSYPVYPISRLGNKALQGLDVQFYPASRLYNCSYLTYHLDSHIPASLQPYVSREFQKFNRDQSKRILFPGLSFFLSKECNDVWINPEECLYIDKTPYFVHIKLNFYLFDS